jgi:hypothetical protein
MQSSAGMGPHQQSMTGVTFYCGAEANEFLGAQARVAGVPGGGVTPLALVAALP